MAPQMAVPMTRTSSHMARPATQATTRRSWRRRRARLHRTKRPASHHINAHTPVLTASLGSCIRGGAPPTDARRH
eukprot:scaffold101399_cov118-Phaeocystis_antarctica.AAC.1